MGWLQPHFEVDRSVDWQGIYSFRDDGGAGGGAEVKALSHLGQLVLTADRVGGTNGGKWDEAVSVLEMPALTPSALICTCTLLP